LVKTQRGKQASESEQIASLAGGHEVIRLSDLSVSSDGVTSLRFTPFDPTSTDAIASHTRCSL